MTTEERGAGNVFFLTLPKTFSSILNIVNSKRKKSSVDFYGETLPLWMHQSPKCTPVTYLSILGSWVTNSRVHANF